MTVEDRAIRHLEYAHPGGESFIIIAALLARIEELKTITSDCRDAFEYSDNMVESGALARPESVPAFIRSELSAIKKAADKRIEELTTIVSGKTMCDVEKITAARCAEIAKQPNNTSFDEWIEKGTKYRIRLSLISRGILPDLRNAFEAGQVSGAEMIKKEFDL